MKKQISHIREFFWPMLEPLPEAEAEAPEPEIEIADENLEFAFVLNTKIFESEEERRKGIESKATLLLSTISVASSIIVTGSAFLSGNGHINAEARLSIVVSCILAIYAGVTVWYSVKALERGKYQVVSFKDINLSGSKTEYYRQLIAALAKKTRNNYPVINNKVDYLALAQEFYKRAVAIICLYAFVILIYSFFTHK